MFEWLGFGSDLEIRFRNVLNVMKCYKPGGDPGSGERGHPGTSHSNSFFYE
jgi:hypothetical protein